MISGGFDIDAERRKMFSEKWGCPVFESLEETLTATVPDILFIAAHPDSRLELVECGLRQEVEVIVCEKPLTGDIVKNRGTVCLPCRSGDVPVLIEAGVGRDHLPLQLELSFEQGMLRIGNGIFLNLIVKIAPTTADSIRL